MVDHDDEFVSSDHGYKTMAQQASDQIETEGLGAFLDACPSETYSTVDHHPFTTRFVFEDGSALLLKIDSVTVAGG